MQFTAGDDKREEPNSFRMNIVLNLKASLSNAAISCARTMQKRGVHLLHHVASCVRDVRTNDSIL